MARPIWALKAPARPRSAVTAMSKWVLSWPVPTSSGGAVDVSVTDPASARSIRSIRSAYGREASACCCARRSFDAATIFMAEVIFWVDFTLLMRVRRAFRLGILPLQACRAPRLGRPHQLNDFAKLSRREVSFFSISGLISSCVRMASKMPGSFDLTSEIN